VLADARVQPAVGVGEEADAEHVIRKWATWPGSEDDGGMVYLHSMGREFCFAMGALALSGLNAQNDSIFPNVEGNWVTHRICWDAHVPPYPLVTHTYTDYLLDTDLRYVSDGLNWDPLIGGWDYIGAIAVDGHRVLYKQWMLDVTGGFDLGDSLPRVLYDFDLNVGDTAYGNDESSIRMVEAVDTIDFGGHMRKRLHLTWGETWVAGMGSSLGLFRPFQEEFECICQADYFCASYADSSGSSYQICADFTSVQETGSSVRAMTVSPVPADVLVRIELDKNQGPLRIFKGDGALVLEVQKPSSSEVLDISSWPSGPYIASTSSERKRFVVAH